MALTRDRKQKTTNWLGIGLGAVAVLAIAGGGIYFALNTEPYKDVQEAYIKSLEKQDYKKMGQQLSTASVKNSGYQKQEIVDKYDNIFNGLGFQGIEAKEVKVTKGKDKGSFLLSYKLTMQTPLGELEQGYQTNLIKEDKEYKVEWNPSLIFEGMSGKDIVLLEMEPPARGKIQDRNGTDIATNQNANQVGIIPGQLGTADQRAGAIKQISEALDVTEDFINEQLSASWVQDDHFVPIKTLIDETPNLEGIPGLTIGQTPIRYYPLKEAGAQLIGYTGQVTAEDIEKNSSLKANSLIGKTGLEAAFDKELRGVEGGVLKVADQNRAEKKVLIQQETKAGETIVTTLDAAVQAKAYEQIAAVKGATVVMNPLEGDVMALVSSPSFNPNKMANGISKKDYDAYANNDKQPFLARYATGYAPGSTFKTITAAIGMDAGITTPEKSKEIQGEKWQKDVSWGGYWVTRVSNVSPVNMVDALIYSDNIYFAQEGLEMGEQVFRTGLAKFQFDHQFDLPLEVAPGQVSNEKSFGSEILLADTAYGQGELLISPLQQATMYSVFANQGTMTFPKLLKDKEKEQVPNVVTADSANKVKDAMLKVVSDPNGTAHGLNSASYQLAAKTGTAEIKEKQDIKGLENSFLLAFDGATNQPLVVSLVESAEAGQSATVLNQALIDSIMTK